MDDATPLTACTVRLEAHLHAQTRLNTPEHLSTDTLLMLVDAHTDLTTLRRHEILHISAMLHKYAPTIVAACEDVRRRQLEDLRETLTHLRDQIHERHTNTRISDGGDS